MAGQIDSRKGQSSLRKSRTQVACTRLEANWRSWNRLGSGFEDDFTNEWITWHEELVGIRVG